MGKSTAGLAAFAVWVSEATRDTHWQFRNVTRLTVQDK